MRLPDSPAVGPPPSLALVEAAEGGRMTWEDVLDAVVGSVPGDWHVVAGEHGLDPDAPPRGDEIGYHRIAVYRPDVAITLLWGRTVNADFREAEWANHFADPSARSLWLDVRFLSVPVFRELMVSVDGGRCLLPLPDRSGEARSVPMAYSRLVRLVQRLRGVAWEYDDYFRRAGLLETGEEWPR